jgi:flagellar hook-associated protein 2
MASISSTSNSSAIDVASIVSQLMVAENKPLDAVKVSIANENLIISDLGNVKSKISALQAALNKFEDVNSYNAVTAASSAPSVISAIASNGATLGRYDVQVSQTAEPTKINIGGANTAGNLSQVTVDATGFQITVGQNVFAFAAGTTTTKLTDLTAFINGLNKNITASVVAVSSTNWNLSIQGTTGSDNKVSINNLNGGSLTDNGDGTGSTIWSNGISETFNARGVSYSAGITQTNNLAFSSALNSSLPTIQMSQGGVNTPIGDYIISSLSGTSLTLTNKSTGVSQSIGVSNPSAGQNTLNFNELGLKINYTTSATPGDTAANIISDLTGKIISIKPPTVSGTDISIDLNSTAMNSLVSVNGINYSRNSNSISDIINRVTLNIMGNVKTTQETLKSNISLTQGADNSLTTIQGLITTYNDVINLYKTLTKNADATAGGDFASQKSLLSYIAEFKNRIAQGFRYGDTTNMSFSEVGLSLNLDGTVSFDTIKYTNASLNGLQAKLSSGAKVGYVSATNTLKTQLTSVLSFGGTIDSQVNNSNTKVTQLTSRQKDLQLRLEAKQKTYTTQYANLNTLLFNFTNTSNALTSSLTALTNMNASK